MDLIEWRDEYSIGVGLFDTQHQHLVKLANELITEFSDGGHTPRISELMADLYQHTLAHFDYEERFMLHYGYPGYVEHCRSHREFLKEIEAVGAETREQDFKVKVEHVQLLSTWFVEHITSEDSKYRAFFQEAEML